MDITDSSPERIDLGVEQLINGGSISYHRVVFYLDKTKSPSELVVSSYSDWFHMENVKPAEAERKIERSKEVAQDLAEKSANFRAFWHKVSHRFIFCLDEGTGAILVAEEKGGRIIWKH